MLKTLPANRKIRPDVETEVELARNLWLAQDALFEALQNLSAFCGQRGDLHGGKDLAKLVAIEGRDVAEWMRELAGKLDETILSEGRPSRE